MIFVSESINDTYKIAEKVARKCKGGEIILLNGELGAGKTTFTKGFAKALNVKNNVTSPTFTIMKSYYGDLTLRHFDMYRINDEEELEELGFDDYFYGNDVCLVEWNKVKFIEKNVITVNIEYSGENERTITIEGVDL